MSEQVRPEGVDVARGVITALALVMIFTGLLVSAFTFTVSGWTVMAGVGVALLWGLTGRES